MTLFDSSSRAALNHLIPRKAAAMSSEPGATTRALLLLDVDGPLNPYGRKGNKRDELPLQYKTLRLRPKGWEWTKHPLRVWVSELHGPMLTAFAADNGVELVWATTWEHDANTMIGPEIGLPVLPVIEFGGHPATVKGWKYPAVLDYAAGRPLAWLDDDFKQAVHRAAKEQFLAAREGTPTLLHHVAPAVGITDLDLVAVAAWLDREVPRHDTEETQR